MTDGAVAPGVEFARGVTCGELRYQRCATCVRAVFYPRVLCPYCGSVELAWSTSEGRGVVYAQTWVSNRSGGYSVVLVDLDEGFRMMSSVVGADAHAITTGARVHAAFDEADGVPRVVFELSEVSR